jgi:integral membrane protein
VTDPVPPPAAEPARPPARGRAIGGALTRYRVMAFVTGVWLVLATFVGIPVQIWGHHDMAVGFAWTAHGYLYLVYLVATADLGLRLRWPLWRMVLVALAGTVPFCSFIAERKVTARVHAEQADTLGR